jgi:hypothetical protein
MKELHKLTKKEYEKLNKIGMLYVLYPEAVGNYHQDIVSSDLGLNKPKFKIGDWVHTGFAFKEYPSIYRVVGFHKDLSLYMKFENQGEKIYSSHDFRKAKPEEIKQHLIKEAKKRGFKEGVKVRVNFPKYSSVYENFRSWKMNESRPKYEGDRDAIRMGGGIIYFKGKWAEIIKEEPIKIGEYEVEFRKGQIDIGCRTFNNDYIKALNRIVLHIKRLDVNMEIDCCGDIYWQQKSGERVLVPYTTLQHICTKLKE